MKIYLITLFCIISSLTYSQCVPQAIYKLDNNANDESGNQLNGTILNGVTGTLDRFGNPNSAMAFNGASQYIELPDDFDYSQRTINAWFKADTSTTQPAVIYDSDHPNMVNSSTKMYVWIWNSVTSVCMSTGNSGLAFHNQPINLNQWYMGTIVVGTDVKFYLDAQLIATFSLNPGVANQGNSTALIGSSRLIDRFFDGAIDDVSIYPCALSASEISQLYLYQSSGIHGKVYLDLDENCLINQNEIGISGRTLIINPGNIVTQTNSIGSWYIDSLPAGNYTVTLDTSGNWLSTCPPSQNFTVIDPDSLTIAPDFGLYSTLPCPGPMISTNMPFIRRCFSNQKIYVQACNNITATDVLNNAYVEVTIDPLLIVTSASLPYTVTGNGDIYHFDLSDLALLPGECESFWIATTVSCNANLNQTLCYEAELFPVSNCVLDTIPSDPPLDFTPCSLPWDQSSISVDGWCDDGNIYFTITNTGDPGDGDMECYSPVRLYIDGDYISLDSVMLLGGDIDTLIFAGDGRTWRLEVDQHPLHPGNSHPNAVVELCGDSANWTPNLVNSMPLDDADPIVDIYCGLVTGSYDPNDKTGYPLGIGANHYILPNGKMEYVIRFQNTGNDTAFTVVVRDTLDIDLNILTVNSGVSSHNYTFQMQGPRVLEWTFENIMLPDSTTDEPGSNGFVTFTVDQVSDLPDGTEINNEVGIYFDFNAPVITNTTSHIIQRNISTPSYTTTTNISDTACFEYSLNDLTYTSTGQYYQVNGTALLNLDLLIANPQINANATEDTVCLNQSTVLTGTGGLTYSWSDGINNNEPFAPESSQYYYVSGTDQFGCTNSDSILITVNDSLVEADFAITLQNYTVILQSTSTPSNHNTTWTVNGVVVSTDDLLNYTFTTNGTYEICLIAENSCNGDTECLNVNVDGLGIHVISEPNLIVYPNPAFNTLFIDYPLELTNKNYSIYDATGKIVKQGILNQNSIDIEMLSAGIFMIEIKNDNVVNKIKFIKQ